MCHLRERQAGSISMKFPQYAISFFFLLFFILIISPPSFAEGGPPDLLAAKGSSLKSAEHSDPEARLILLINQIRARAGLRPLKPSRLLGEVARAHSREMRDEKFFSHTNSDGWGPKERLERAGFAWKAYGENIGCGQDSPEKILQNWMNSASHRETLLNPVYTEVGIGLVRGGECRTYWTGLFARPRS
jgi:uncharacterized protein YkwD